MKSGKRELFVNFFVTLYVDGVYYDWKKSGTICNNLL